MAAKKVHYMDGHGVVYCATQGCTFNSTHRKHEVTCKRCKETMAIVDPSIRLTCKHEFIKKQKWGKGVAVVCADCGEDMVALSMRKDAK